jgi:hypothetical protein
VHVNDIDGKEEEEANPTKENIPVNGFTSG